MSFQAGRAADALSAFAWKNQGGKKFEKINFFLKKRSPFCTPAVLRV
jgi:hypothetical protein